jgi:hypothetical protein
MSRHPRSNTDDPTAERTADSSTQTASGLGTPRPGPGVERNRQPDDDPVRRTGEERDTTPRRYEQTTDDDPVMPAEDSSLNTKI